MTKGGGQGRGDSERDARLRHTAVQLAGQLPPEIEDAREVVRLMDVLIREFLADPRPADRPDGDNVTQLRARVAPPGSNPPEKR